MTGENISKILSLKFFDIMTNNFSNVEEASLFQETILENAHAVKEAIDSNARSFEEFLVLLERADRFKEWLKGVNPDAKVVKEYYESVVSDTWAQSLPVKLIRFCISAGVGAAWGPLGTAVSAADSFLIDRFMGGWRPSHFVEENLKPFVTE